MSRYNDVKTSHFSFFQKGIYFLFILTALSVLSKDSFAQIYSFDEIKTFFLQERPQTGDPLIREECLISIDDLIIRTYPPLHPDAEPFFGFMIEKAVLEIKYENVIEGATVWQICNHGFVVKTPSIIIGFDLYIYPQFRDEDINMNFLELGDLIDIYFISHTHGDHFSQKLIDKMTDLGKPVVGPIETDEVPIKMSAGESQVISGLNIIAHNGSHSVPLRQFEVTTEEGLKFFHTGDHSNSDNFPVVNDIDVMMVNCWIGGGVPLAVERMQPQVTLPGHMMELNHFIGDDTPLPYEGPIAEGRDSLASEYYVLGWGERYHLNNASNDTIAPDTVRNIIYEIQNDSLLVLWDTPAIAADGDSASFYRIIIDNSEEYFNSLRHFSFHWDSIRTYNFKIYSFDDCGNQSKNHNEIDVTIPNINYPPFLQACNPVAGDTIQIFSGVHSKLFSVDVIDLNNDLLYDWAIDQQTISDEISPSFLFKISDLDSGLHQLTVTVSDSVYSEQISWAIDYCTDFSIVDNEDSLVYSEFGSWNYDLKSACGDLSRYTRNVGDWAQFNFYAEREGNYDVYEIIPRKTDALNNVIYCIFLNEQPLDSVGIDQNENSGNWTKLGSYSFPAQSDVAVKIVNTGSSTKGKKMYSDAVKFDYLVDVTDLEDICIQIPDEYTLAQNYPNPFNPSTTIKFVISGNQKVSLKMYNIKGQVVETLVDEYKKSGEYSVTWNPHGLSNGIYFCELKTDNFRSVRKLIMQK